MRHRPWSSLAIRVSGVSAAVMLASCGAAVEVPSATVAPSTATTDSPPTSPPPTPTTATPTTAQATAPPQTTAPPPTTGSAPTTASPGTAAPAETTPSTSAPPAPTSGSPATAYIATGGQVLEVMVDTGEAVGVVADMFSGDGVFRGGLRLMPDRESLWYSEGYEDSWYSCDSSEGMFGRLDLTTREMSTAGAGVGPEPSANGLAVATRASERCIPDPENEELWVLTPYDRVVIYLVADGESREFVTDTPPDTYEAPSAVQWVGFSTGGNLLAMTGDRQLRNIDISGSNVIQDHPVVLAEVLGTPVAATADALISVVFGDEGSSDLYSTDAITGEATLLASSETYMAVGVSLDEHIIVASSTEVTIAPGAGVSVLPGWSDDFIDDIDW